MSTDHSRHRFVGLFTADTPSEDIVAAIEEAVEEDDLKEDGE